MALSRAPSHGTFPEITSNLERLGATSKNQAFFGCITEHAARLFEDNATPRAGDPPKRSGRRVGAAHEAQGTLQAF